MPHSNGKIFTSTSSSGVKLGIDVIDDIAYVLGRSTGDLGQLCGDVNASGQDQNRIKKWSKFKPVRNPSKGASTQADVEKIMKAAHFGLLGDMGYTTDDEAVFNAYLQNTGDWVYEKPRGLAHNEPFRLLDFWGYDHSAKTVPITVDSGVVDSEPEGRRIYFTFTINTAASIQMKDFDFADWSSYDSSSADNNFKYAVMIRKRGATGSPTIHYGINVFKLSSDQKSIEYNHRQTEGPNEVIYFTAPTESGVYEMVPCIVKHEPSQSSHGQILYLPAGQMFTYNGSDYTTAYCDNFQVLSKTVGSHRPTAQELANGTGYLDVTFNISVRVLRNSTPSASADPGSEIKYVTRIGSSYTRSATSHFVSTYGDSLPKAYTYTSEHLYSSDSQLLLPVVPLDYGEVVTIWCDFYDHGDNLLGSEQLAVIV